MKNKELPEGVKERIIIRYDCKICGLTWPTINAAKTCYNKGVDNIKLPKGFVFGICPEGINKKDINDLYFLILNFNEEPPTLNATHENIFYWRLVNPDFNYNPSPEIAPNSSSKLRKMLHKKSNFSNIFPITDKEFNYFFQKANNIKCIGTSIIKNFTKEYNLTHRHQELTEFFEKRI